ncbi:MAG: glucose-1-phosphate adenylyltransferase [Bacilli bacterium]|nr:glucose-1-phosphate adenylyltransferase [Bacilli bacterium]
MDKKIVAMILAGGKGTRLESLTKKNAKPAVSFAAKYRIIDFAISNCANSGFNDVGVLVQYESTALENYLGNGEKWGLNGVNSHLLTIAPRQTEKGAVWYKGTADAIAQNIETIDKYKPDIVVVLSGDHIYKTTYNDMVSLHVNSKADATISVMEVDIKEASRYGIMEVDDKDNIIHFVEKPRKPKNNLASMGVYVFTWSKLRKFLIADSKNPHSSHDFGHDIIPMMIKDNKKIKAYRFKGYWRDVGTLESLHAANMDICLARDTLDLYDWNPHTRIFTEDTPSMPQYVGKQGHIINSIANQGAIILGDVNACVLSSDVLVDKGAKCDHSVIMAGATIEAGAEIHNVIVAPNTVIKKNSKINLDNDEIILVS